jgi:hypothetical protein
MSKTAPPDSYTDDTDPPSTDAGEASQREREAGLRSSNHALPSNVIFVDFSDTQLRLLRIKTRKLEESRYLLYKGLTTAVLASGTDTADVTVRVLVKHRMIDYYYYHPRSDERVSGRIDATYQCAVDGTGLSWKEVEALVREFVWKRSELSLPALCDTARGD